MRHPYVICKVVAKERMRNGQPMLYKDTISIPHGKNGSNVRTYIWEIDCALK